jgi:hypothetical protein
MIYILPVLRMIGVTEKELHPSHSLSPQWGERVRVRGGVYFRGKKTRKTRTSLCAFASLRETLLVAAIRIS